MKKTVLFGFLFFSIFSVNLTAQENQLFQLTSVNFNNISLDSALHVLEDIIDLNFTYNSEFATNQKIINAQFNFIPLSIILDSLFNNPCLNYKIVNKQLVVYGKKNNSSANSPTSDNIKIITGKITDIKNGEILSYSSIGILNRTIGTISNNDGDFILKINQKFLNDTLVITHIGYQNYLFPISKMHKNKIFQMEPKTVSLPEIVIRNSIPENLIRKAIQNTKTNYFIDPYILRAFYRETVKQNNKYMIYTEGILNLYKCPLRPTLYKDQIKLLKLRNFTNINPNDTVLFKLKGGLRTSLQLDIVKNSMEFIEQQGMNLYKYKIQDMLIIDGKLAYLIKFSPKSHKTIPAFEGEICIEVNSLAFLKIVFGYTQKSIRNLKSSFVLKTSKGVKAIPDEVKYDVSYKESDGKYFINHVKGSLKFRVKKKRKLLSSIYETTFEMVTTDINNINPYRFSSSETLKTNKIFSDQNSKYNIDFWESNNFILPEEDLIKALERFKKEELEIR
ncbi:MAG: carboxypeptidase-like regulatory domain-containing protein [Bacteroidales bacterium]|nr:carboxypeptidase-like regulatory domain-containing protein [Bacteroidales bacterium]